MLGSAAGLAILGGPHAAGAVEYVKICSIYGPGFYYMPGTDTCIKIGGWVRAETAWGVNGNLDLGPFNSNSNTRYTNNFTVRERGYITADARETTGYGVARGYIAVGIDSNNTGAEIPAGQFNAHRAFVQWAGMTAGFAKSYYDYYSDQHFSYHDYLPSSDTRDAGWWVWAYTAQFGGGITATLSAEERRITQNIAFSGVGGALGGPAIPGTNGALPGGAFVPGAGYGGWQMPDIVANMRLDQKWGGFQVMGALHEVNAAYYGAMPASGHPDDALGFAAGAGFYYRIYRADPHGLLEYYDPCYDELKVQLSYTQGAPRYVSFFDEGDWAKANGTTEGYGVMSDCVYGGAIATANATSCQLTTAWGVNAAYEHRWTRQFHESLYGSYMNVSYNNEANGMLCVGEGFGAGAGTTATAAAGCNNDWSTWGIGSRLQYDVSRSFYVGVDVLYQELISAKTPTGGLPAGAILTNSGAMTVANQSNWSFTLRAHKDFLP